MLFDLIGDPFERAQHDSEDYNHWAADHMFMVVPAQSIVKEFLETFKEYPQRQAIGSFSLDRVMDQMNSAKSN